MLNFNIERVNFYDDFFERQKKIDCILKINYKDNNHIFYKSKKVLNNKKLKNTIFSIQVIPEYFSLTYSPFFKSKIIKEFRIGYAAKLNAFNDVKSYVKNQYKDKHAREIFKNIKRLETRCDINYVLFYGEIQKDQYNYIMDTFYNMITKRFKQRNDLNYRLDEWKDLYDSIFDLIKLKRASLFVIYNVDKPIQISIQYHFQDILIYSLASYDINYSKFGLGNIAIYKQIDWCIKNGYNIFDLGHGDLIYKRRWSNLIYNYYHNIVYNPKNIKSICFSMIEALKASIKWKIRSKNIEATFIKRRESYSKPSISNVNKKYEVTTLVSFNTKSEYKRIDWKSLEFEFLTKIVCDYLYHNLGHFNEIKVYQNKFDIKKFVLENGNNFQKVIFY